MGHGDRGYKVTYLIELTLTIWAAFSVRAINRNARYGLESGISCNLCFLTWWLMTNQLGFFVGDLVFSAMYGREIYLKYRSRYVK
jgi:hypothetical protein